MDVDKIQKINDLAMDLMNQGLAQNRDEAVAQAEKIFHGQQGPEKYSEIRERMDQVQAEKEPVKVEETISQEQIKEILSKNTNFLVNTIKEFQQKIVNLERELVQMKQQMHQLSGPTVREMAQPTPEPEQKPEAQEQKQEEPKKEGEGHPRSGNYSDQDVSIEKYFYMGSK